GQMVYDNLHWNKMTKDILMATTRSVGWNIGTLRELGGGAIDWGRFATAKVRGAKVDVNPYSMAYTLALPVLTGVIGALAQKTLTGDWPQELRDYFFPRTGTKDENGRDQRVSLPGYMKDVYAYGHDPIATVSHKLSPVLGLVGELLHNEDFYGTQIRDPQANAGKQALQVAKHVAGAFTPFAARGEQQMAKSGEGTAMKVAPFFGVTPAPASIKKTAAENLATEFMSANMGNRVKTQEQADASEARAQALRAMRNGDYSTASHLLGAGQITARQYTQLVKEAQQTPLQTMFTHLTLPQAEAVYDKATPSERHALMVEMLRKQAAGAKAAGFPRRGN
ncbi:MAG TPA: hypothetical protein VG733_18870, partial [Chthoniobacteraceae bacterium]|nr:hypothetical protein [Chthoniobacteraceae bacterium]